MRIAWACLIYNLVFCCHVASQATYDFFNVSNLLVLCLTNGAAIVATIASYKNVRWMHTVAPLIMLTQLAACLSMELHELSEENDSQDIDTEVTKRFDKLIVGSFILLYCLCQLALVTKWIV